MFHAFALLQSGTADLRASNEWHSYDSHLEENKFIISSTYDGCWLKGKLDEYFSDRTNLAIAKGKDGEEV